MTVTATRVLMTPAGASQILARNENRNLPATQAIKFRDIILNGLWIEDANPWRIDTNGDLRDGQSRATGLVLAGQLLADRGDDPDDCEVWVLLAEGLAPEAQLVMDTGRRRNFNHWLQIQHVRDSAAKAAATTLWWNYLNGRLDTRPSFTMRREAPHAALWDLFSKREPEIIAAHAQAQAVTRFLRLSPSVVAVAWLILSPIDAEDAADFFGQLKLEIAFEERTGPALLIRMWSNRARKHYDQQQQLAFIVKAWNMYRDAQLGDLLRWAPGGKAREPFPEPL